jgi:hypothetical protein
MGQLGERGGLLIGKCGERDVASHDLQVGSPLSVSVTD